MENIIRKMQTLTNNRDLKLLLQSYGYDVMNVVWEDTARTAGSACGHNISDMTLNYVSPDGENILMPVIRKPNFVDLSTDISIDKFSCPVGNETLFLHDAELKTIPLKEYLQDIGKYTNTKLPSMILNRDEKILTSTQYCLLPCTVGASTQFNVKLYNYQSYKDNPAVLIVIVSSQGTSCQIVDSSNTTLNFNLYGDNANFKVERLKDDRVKRGVDTDGNMTKEEKSRNVLYIFQIPLKQKPKKLKRSYTSNIWNDDDDSYFGCASPDFVPTDRDDGCASTGFDHGLLSVKKSTGKYGGISQSLVLERDANYPIRVTLQHYMVSDTNVIPPEIVREMVASMDNIFRQGLDLSSLVVENTNRPTESSIKKNAYNAKNIKSVPIFNF